MKNIKITDYLNEQRLFPILTTIFDGCLITKQHRMKIDGKLLIVDFLIITKFGQLIIEFNGNLHYQRAETQLRDNMLRDYCMVNDIMLVEIPYFIQLTNDTAAFLFSKDVVKYYLSKFNISTTFPHGFISPKLTLPCDFNIAGWNRFMSDIHNIIPHDHNLAITRQIWDSLYHKMESSTYPSISCTVGVDMYTHFITPSTFFENYPT
jgi:hypothetical protein